MSKQDLEHHKAMINKTIAVLKQLSADEQVREEYLKHEMRRMNNIGSLRDAEQNGLEQGLAQGRAEGEAQRTSEIARNMKAEKLPLALIAKLTGLSELEIEKLS